MLATLAHLFTPQNTNNHRPRILHPEGFVVLTAIALVFNILVHTVPTFATTGTVLGYSSSITVGQVLNSINAQREQSGLKDLRSNTQLDQAASAKASNMLAEQYWAHISPSGITPWVFFKNAGYQYSVAGENLARDFSDTDSMVSAWMASPSHKENILNSRYSDTGIAVVDGQLLGTQTTLVVQMFGAPINGAAAIPTKGATTAKVAPVVKVAAQPQVEPQPVQGLETIAPAQTSQPPATPFYSPLQISKAIALSMLGLLVGVLVFDMVTANKRKTVRITGKNLAHIALFSIVAIAVILFKGGLLS